MLRITEIRLPLDHNENALKHALLERLSIDEKNLSHFHIFRRGYDARKRGQIVFVYTLDCYLTSQDLEKKILERPDALSKHITIAPDIQYRFVVSPFTQSAPKCSFLRPVIVGAGPCGVMAGLLLAQMGFSPLILERGKPVRERTVDTFAFWRQSKLNPESNVQFGEGGAGTFSDGKLHSQISDPKHYGRKVLEEFVKAGAPEEILFLSKPHIGTFRLVSMVEHIRSEIESLGGEYRFNSKVEGIKTGYTPSGEKRIEGLVLADGTEIEATHVIFAVGHSARDTFEMLHEMGITLHAKPFSIGVRIEHPQSLIDKQRFGAQAGHPLLGAADYKLAYHSVQRGAYSFCMCPGGTVVAATSEKGQVVTNGMSQYSRAERNANSGLVVEVIPGRDYGSAPLDGIHFQRKWEHLAFEVGGHNYRAPAQLVEDFLANRPSQNMGDVVPSYKPGVTPTHLKDCLPDFVIETLKEALPAFNRKLSGYTLSQAVMTGVETRTSSPLRITRSEQGESLSLKGFYPAGEGAGYAGGILSAAIDGLKTAEWVALSLASSLGG